MVDNARRLGERGGLGAPKPELPQGVMGNRRLDVTTPTAIALSRLLYDVCPDAGSTYLSFFVSWSSTHFSSPSNDSSLAATLINGY